MAGADKETQVVHFLCMSCWFVCCRDCRVAVCVGVVALILHVTVWPSLSCAHLIYIYVYLYIFIDR